MSETELSSALHAREHPRPGRPSVDEVRWRAGRHHRRRLATTAASVAVVLALGTALVLSLRTPGRADMGYALAPSRAAGAPRALPTVPTRGAVPDGPSYDCASGFSGRGLRRMDFALAGTVASIASTRTNEQLTTVTLRVGRWWRGGPARVIRVQMQPPYGAPGAEVLGYRVGTRLMVAGESTGTGYAAGGCGFTRYWTATDAHLWHTVVRA